MKFQEFDWRTGALLIAYHLVLLVALPVYLYYVTPSWGLLIWTLVLVFLCGTGISAGYHRFYAHRAYQLHPLVEYLVLLFGTLSVQGSVVKWSHDHRLHHRFVDTENDPYSVKKGFWHAHILWILKKGRPFNNEVVQDLLSRKLLFFQHRYYVPLFLAVNVGVVFLFGGLLGDYWGAFVFLVLLRIFITHHCTFFINSLAHYWGSQPYTKENSSVNNWIISFLTFGEGYHNYHHAFPSDYRNGVRWYQYDSTKLFIWALNKLRLARDLRRVDLFIAQRRSILEDKRLLLEKIREIGYLRWEEIEKKVTHQADKLSEGLSRIRAQIQAYKSLKAQKARKERLEKVQRQIKQLEKSMDQEYKEWGILCKNILRLKPRLT